MCALRSSDLDMASGEVVVMPMRRRHLRSVLRIEGQALHRGWSLGLFMSEIAVREGRVYLVAKVGGTVVGYAGLLLAAGDGHITTISVDPAWQGNRLATRMLVVLAHKAIERGAGALTLEVRASNEPAIKLYRRFGFAPAGIRSNYYSDIGEDALIMWANDVNTDAYAARLASITGALPSPTVVEEVGW
jgi:[ribosomal protein S18]-alanine N-acetyltransferase